MTTATLVFDPFSEDFFNGPYETYRRMREEAPVYYNTQYDFYALTRHEDVAAAYKDFETFSSARGVDLSMVRKGEVTEHGSIIVMDPPDHRHMRSLLNKVFTPRAIRSQHPMVSALIDKYLSAVNPDGFDMVQDFSALFPVEVITIMQGVPAVDSQRVRLWIDGVTIPAGKPVFLVGGSANRDPAAWTDPDTFDVDRDRTEAQNLGLGYGIHSCLGPALARMESAIALEKMLDFMPRFEVDWSGCRRVNMQNVAGWSNVPVRVLRERFRGHGAAVTPLLSHWSHPYRSRTTCAPVVVIAC
jgi:cytochrome P450